MLARIPLLIPLYVVLSTLMLAWNVLLAGRIAQLRGAPRRFAAASALAGLLVAPAGIVAIAASSTVYGRALQPVAWVWPATTMLFVFQAVYATSRGLVTPFFGVPIVLYDIVIAAVALSKYIVLRGGTPPPYVLALAAAQANALGIVFGASALWKTYLQVPLLAPALPAHWRTTALARVVLGTVAIVVTGFVLVEVPDGLAAVRSYPRYANERPQERPEGDFAIGVKILPDLSAPPSAHALQNDTALIRLLGADVISVSVKPDGVGEVVRGVAVCGVVLDSLNRALDLVSTEATILIVTLAYGADERQQLANSRERYIRARVEEVDLITRCLRPGIVIPAADPYGRGATTLGIQSPEFWQDYMTRTSQAIHRVRPATRVAYSASSYGTRDSVLYAWAATRGSPVDVLGFSLFPGFDGAATLDTRIRVAQRWLRQHGNPPKDHWVLAAGGFPGAHGERSQELAIWAVTAWATTQPAIKGLVVYEAGDYDAIRGLRAPDRRLRPAVNAVSRAKRGLREATQ